MPLPKGPDTPVLSQFSLKGKVIAVTGASQGIGAAVSEGFAEAGADVALLYNTSKEAEALASKLAQKTGRTMRAYQGNVRDSEAITSVLEQVAKEFGHLDVVVANAGVSGVVPVLDASKEDYSKIMSTNVDGAFWTAQAAGRIFARQGHGNLIFTASMSALIVNLPQRQAIYNASKAAVAHLARSLAVEWADWGRVNCVSPGTVKTDLVESLSGEWKGPWLDRTPAGRFCEPHELKGTYVFLASDASSFMTGASIVIDGGYTLP